jgi:hypothetical protein
LDLSLDPARHYYMVAPIGEVTVNGQIAQARDGIAITDESSLRVEAIEPCELVLVDAR